MRNTENLAPDAYVYLDKIIRHEQLVIKDQAFLSRVGGGMGWVGVSSYKSSFSVLVLFQQCLLI